MLALMVVARIPREYSCLTLGASTDHSERTTLRPVGRTGTNLAMQHAEHFLSRLERLRRSEVELALDLYHDRELLRAVLGMASLPEGAERVAISIDDPLLGPFLIVTADGHFVTCLGRGMRVDQLPMVTRVELDTISRKVAKLREKIALAEAFHAGGERASARLLRRLLTVSDSVSREDFLAVAAWEPLLGPVFIDMYLGMACELVEQAPLLCRIRPRGSRAEEALHTFWNLLHAAGHMALLGTMTGEKEHYAALSEGVPGARAAFSYPLTGTGALAFILKGAWAVGRLGKRMLPDYKRALVEDVAFFEFLDSLFALLAIGIRTRGLRGEIMKALHAAPLSARTPQAQRIREVLGQEVQVCCEVTAQLLEETAEELEAVRLRIGASYLGPAAHSLDLDDASREELVRTLPLLSLTDGITNGKNLLGALTLIATTARGAPEQIYLPAELARALHLPWEPAFTWKLLEPIRTVEQARRQPVVRAAKVGRNEACPCGSGQKWKRCCGVSQ